VSLLAPLLAFFPSPVARPFIQRLQSLLKDGRIGFIKGLNVLSKNTPSSLEPASYNFPLFPSFPLRQPFFEPFFLYRPY
jgi:hypothetical protein